MVLLNQKRKPKLLENDRDKGIYSSIFQIFSNNNNIKHYSTKSSFVAVYAEHYNRTIRDLLKRPVFEKCDGNSIDVLPVKTKQ